MPEPLLSVRDLHVDYRRGGSWQTAVDGVSFDVAQGELLGIAGESGCGKSTLGFALMGLSPGRVSGTATLAGELDLISLTRRQWRQVRMNRIAMVFQSAMNGFNPVMTLADQIRDTLSAHGVTDRAEQNRTLAESFDLVELPQARLKSYPHELSGGMRQRAMVALAFVRKPQLVILDEPTTALDVVIQRNILDRILEIQQRFQTTLILISHDLHLLLSRCDRVGVMYAGALVELGSRRVMAAEPAHPYSAGLMACLPPLSGEVRRRDPIPGQPPSLDSWPDGCRFHPRCRFATVTCQSEPPALRTLADSRQLACHHPLTGSSLA